MKKLFFALALVATASLQQGLAQSQPTATSSLLTAYYGIENALVSSNPNTASDQAGVFVKNLQAIDIKSLPDNGKTTFMSEQGKLSKDAAFIASHKDLAAQREHFATLSVNLFTLAKAVKLSSQPIYEAYCPMKKAYWLSSEATIKNPYFGSQMPTCGKLTETLQ
jgi:hypothetical protein